MHFFRTHFVLERILLHGGGRKEFNNSALQTRHIEYIHRNAINMCRSDFTTLWNAQSKYLFCSMETDVFEMTCWVRQCQPGRIWVIELFHEIQEIWTSNTRIDVFFVCELQSKRSHPASEIIWKNLWSWSSGWENWRHFNIWVLCDCVYKREKDINECLKLKSPLIRSKDVGWKMPFRCNFSFWHSIISIIICAFCFGHSISNDNQYMEYSDATRHQCGSSKSPSPMNFAKVENFFPLSITYTYEYNLY